MTHLGFIAQLQPSILRIVTSIHSNISLHAFLSWRLSEDPPRPCFCILVITLWYTISWSFAHFSLSVHMKILCFDKILTKDLATVLAYTTIHTRHCMMVMSFLSCVILFHFPNVLQDKDRALNRWATLTPWHMPVRTYGILLLKRTLIRLKFQCIFKPLFHTTQQCLSFRMQSPIITKIDVIYNSLVKSKSLRYNGIKVYVMRENYRIARRNSSTPLSCREQNQQFRTTEGVAKMTFMDGPHTNWSTMTPQFVIVTTPTPA